MIAEISFLSDTRDPGYRPSTALSAIDAMRMAARDFFEKNADDPDPGIRAGRIAGTGGARLSLADVMAWDRLVRERLLPHVRAERERLAREAGTRPDEQRPIYAHAIALVDQKIDFLIRSQDAFMEGVREATDDLMASVGVLDGRRTSA